MACYGDSFTFYFFIAMYVKSAATATIGVYNNENGA
jgi:hypothetical protein